MFKKILLGVGVMLITLMALGASDCEVETDAPDSPAVTATEVPAVEPEPAVEDDECYLTASCPLQNGWTESDWLEFSAGLLLGLDQGNTPEAVALAGCMADVVMLRMTTTEFLSLTDAENENLAFDIGLNECYPLFEATLAGQ